jgi:fatty acid desaturase
MGPTSHNGDVISSIVFFLGAMVLGLLPAGIARWKGYSFLWWWVYGTLVWIVAFPHSLLKRRQRSEAPESSPATQ